MPAVAKAARHPAGLLQRFGEGIRIAINATTVAVLVMTVVGIVEARTPALPMATATADPAPGPVASAPPVPEPPPRLVQAAPPLEAAPPPSLDAAANSGPAAPDKPTSAAAAVPASQPTTVSAPKPHAREAEHVARFDALIVPARDFAPSVEDATRVRDAIAGIANVAQAKALREQIADPVAKKLVDWAMHRQGIGSARDIKAFLQANPEWPNRDLLAQRAEEQLFTSGGSARDIKAFFAGSEPKTGIGLAALASAHLAENDEAAAKTLAARAWRQNDIPASLETGFIERFGKLLAEADHKWRFDKVLLDDSRWENERRERAAVARRIVPLLSEPEKAKANARLAVYLRVADAGRLLAALPTDAATVPVADWGFAFQLAQWHRRGGRHAEAWKILTDAPTDAAVIVSPDDWWAERRLAAYDALKAGKADVAYAIVKSPGALGINPLKDATFFAGWLSLRHLDNAAAAEGHFRDLEKAADGPLSRGKAGYWLAKTYDKLARPAAAKTALQSAARNGDTFYGLLAQQMLDPNSTRLPVVPPVTPTPAEAAQFNAREVIKATVLARKAGLDPSISRIFLTHLRNTMTSEAEAGLLAHLAEAMGDTQMAVRIAKTAIAKGMNLIYYGYPIHPMPAYQPLRPPPEPAFLLAIARQESEFNPTTKSGAGARGLLQVMPITAQHVCKDYRIRCEVDRLMTDTSYNAMLASAYIADRMDEFTGSYVLTLTGYNAGPGRTRQWMREFGDPRDGKIDPIDWIQRIPFEETREYVHKVLANIQIYRARLGEEATALRLEADLKRTGTSRRAAAERPAPASSN